MEKRKPLGFETPSMRMQEEYEEILEQLKKKKANWGKILAKCAEMRKFDSDGVEDILKRTKSKVTHTGLMELEHRSLALAHSITQIMVARIGKELAECDIRISEVEKELRTIRQNVK